MDDLVQYSMCESAFLVVQLLARRDERRTALQYQSSSILPTSSRTTTVSQTPNAEVYTIAKTQIPHSSCPKNSERGHGFGQNLKLAWQASGQATKNRIDIDQGLLRAETSTFPRKQEQAPLDVMRRTNGNKNMITV